MNRIYLLTIAIFICFGQKYTADFTRLDFGAKTLASGNTFFMSQSDLSAVKWFPADYSFNKKILVFGTYVSKFDGLVEQSHIGFSQPIVGGYNITVNVNYSGVADIPSYERLILNNSNEPNTGVTGFFDNKNMTYSLTLAKVVETEFDLGWDYFKVPVQIPFALNINYLTTELDSYTGRAFTFDLSGGLRFKLGDLFKSENLGYLGFYFNVSNLASSKLAWDEVQADKGSYKSFEPIAHNTIIGTSFSQSAQNIKSIVTFGIQYQSFYEDFSYGLGVLYDDLIEFRIGSDNSDLSFGVGVQFSQFEIFASMKPKHDLGKSMNMDLIYGF